MKIYRRLLFFPYLVLIFCGGLYANEPDASALKIALDAIRAETAPDLRLEVFDVELDADARTARVETTSTAARDKIRAVANDFSEWKIETKLLPEENDELNGKLRGVAAFSTIQLQKGPDHAAEWGTQALMGMPVRVLRRQNGWSLIQNTDGYLGYTTSTSVQELTEAEFAAWLEAPRLVWTDLYGFVYSEPNEDSQTISDLVAGCVVEWLDNEDCDDF
ncbi:MAG: hypothetical protein HUK22_08025 [Thermoguttaceae bacterium]|nr:hypothetical protein [Thermoguttaceae bacterium]